MRHGKKRLQLNRITSLRKATLKGLAKSLLTYQSIKTTRQRAHAAKPLIEKLISLGKTNSLAGRRQAYKILGEHKLVSLLFNEIAPRFAGRAGGYTRILLLGKRRGDDAQLAIFELTEIKKKDLNKPEKKEVKIEEEPQTAAAKEKTSEERKPKTSEAAVREKPPVIKKPAKKFLGGLRGIFKKERDSL